MRQHNAENERVKRDYLIYLKAAKGLSEASLDTVAKAIHRFEVSTKFRPFRKFHIEQAVAFRRQLSETESTETGKPLSKATILQTLNALRAFSLWLAGQPSYRSRISYSDADYFRLSEKDTRIAKAARERPVPTLEQIRGVLAVMPHVTEIERRNRALIAFTLLTGVRDGALASLKLKHVDLAAAKVVQDAREVNTKFSKTFTTWFFPVGDDIRAMAEEWVVYLREQKLWGGDDSLFPATAVVNGKGLKFEVSGLARRHWSNAGPIRTIFRDAFRLAGLMYFNPHSFRKTLAQLGERVCRTPEELKAWSQNLGHEDVLTTLRSYGEVPSTRQAEIIKNLNRPNGADIDADTALKTFVSWLTKESGWTVEEDSKPVAIGPRHVCILFRRFRAFSRDVTWPYVRALESRHIPHVLVGGRSLHEREEIIALQNALAAIEWPDDELKVFATLRGPLFAVGDEALLAFRQHIGSDGELQIRRLHPMHAVDRSELDPVAHEVADALALLARLHVGRNHRPIAQTIMMLLDAVRAQAGIALWPTGEQALANCLRMVDLARRFERVASSFRAFIEEIEADAETGEADEAPIVEEGTEGVRVMTVHKAKGLEFPVVILADPTCPASRDTPSRHVEPARRVWLEPLCSCAPAELLEAADKELRRDRAEAVRVAYVAATRARDLLVVPVVGDGPIAGWLDVLKPALYPLGEAKRRSSPAPGCPAFGKDGVLDRGPEGISPAGG